MDATWNKETVYDEQINPLMAQIIAICKEHKIPMVASFEYGRRGDADSDLCSTYLAFGDEAPACNRLKLAYQAIYDGVLSYMVTRKA